MVIGVKNGLVLVGVLAETVSACTAPAGAAGDPFPEASSPGNGEPAWDSEGLLDAFATDSIGTEAMDGTSETLRAPDLPPFPPDCVPGEDARYAVRGAISQVALTQHDLQGGVVHLLEDPALATTTSTTGEFEITGVKSCTRMSLVFEHPEMLPVQSGIVFLEHDDLENVTLQTPDQATYDLFVLAAGVEPDPALCQIATTVTKAENWGKGPCHACGEPGATVEIWPPVSSPPIYFYLEENGIIYPLPTLLETTEDGGVLFANVPPGDYVLVAHKEGHSFTPIWVTCRAGWFVNASPPYGIQGLD